MNATQREPRHLSDLSSEELDRLARAHVDGFFDEVRGAGEHVRTEWNPLTLAGRHPVATAAVVGAAGLAAALLVRGRRREARGSAAGGAEPIRAAEPIGHAVSRTLLTGLAGAAVSVLPELLAAYLRRRAASGEPEV